MKKHPACSQVSCFDQHQSLTHVFGSAKYGLFGEAGTVEVYKISFFHFTVVAFSGSKPV